MKLNLILTGLFMLILIPISVLGLDSYDWYQSGYSLENTGTQSNAYSQYPCSALIVTGTTGSDFQPLAFDADNDGTTEVIYTHGNYVYASAWDGSAMSPIDTYNVGSSQLVMMSAIPNYDGDSYEEFCGVFSDGHIYVFEFNGTRINVEQSNESNSSGILADSGIRCIDTECYYVSQDSASLYVTVYHANNNTVDHYDTGLPDSDTHYADYFAPPAFDIDRDGVIELAISTGDEAQAHVCVWDSNTHTLDTSFSTDGCHDTILQSIRGIIMADIDGFGGGEIAATSAGILGAGGGMVAVSYYGSDGSTIWSKTFNELGIYAANNYYMSNPIILNYYRAAASDVICFAHSGNDVVCLQHADGTPVYNLVVQDNFYQRKGAMIIGANMDINNDDVEDIITGSTILDLDDFGHTGYYAPHGINITNNPETHKGYNPVVGDFDGDGNLDIFAMEAGGHYTAFSSFTNQNAVLDNSFQYGGYGANIDYTSPLCMNTSITFHAWECISENCNYDNDFASDTERLSTDCGYHAELINGSWALANPSVICDYNSTGNYLVTIYIHDDKHTSSYTEYNTQAIMINVIDGIPGETCNLGTIKSGSSAAEDESLPIDADIDATLGILLGTSTTLRLIIGIAIIIGIIVMAAQAGLASGIALLFIGLLATVMMTFIGLIPSYILVFIIISSMLLLFFSKFITGGSGGE